MWTKDTHPSNGLSASRMWSNVVEYLSLWLASKFHRNYCWVLLVKYTITKPFGLLCRENTKTGGQISLAEHLRAFRSLVQSGINLQRWGWVDSEVASVPASGWVVGSFRCCVQGFDPVSQSQVKLDHVQPITCPTRRFWTKKSFSEPGLNSDEFLSYVDVPIAAGVWLLFLRNTSTTPYFFKESPKERKPKISLRHKPFVFHHAFLSSSSSDWVKGWGGGGKKYEICLWLAPFRNSFLHCPLTPVDSLLLPPQLNIPPPLQITHLLKSLRPTSRPSLESTEKPPQVDSTPLSLSRQTIRLQRVKNC